MTERAFACVVVLIAAASTPLTAHLSPLTLQDTTRGKAVYVKWCAGCHGDGGARGGGTDPAALKEGRRFYEDSIHCNKCHGDEGRGDGPSAPTLKDDAGFPIYAADLHQNWRFRGGGTVEDIYHRLRTGLDGTPMPSFSDLIEQK